MENPFIGAYWSARQETRRECAERVAKFLSSIAEDPVFARWSRKSYSRKAPKAPIEITVETIERQLKEQFTDIPKRPMPELGFSLGIWNGNNEASAGFSVTCGAYSKIVSNAVVLNLPRQEPPRDAASFERFHALLKNAVEAFEPDVAVATSSELNARGSGTVRENEAWIKYRRDQGTVFRTALDKAG